MKVKEPKTLHELTEIWMAMERKTFVQREKAERYYEKNLMQPIIENYKERNENMVFEQVDYLILSVGTSYEPLILNISLLKTFTDFCHCENINFTAYDRECSFLNPINSQYYKIMGEKS